MVLELSVPVLVRPHPQAAERLVRRVDLPVLVRVQIRESLKTARRHAAVRHHRVVPKELPPRRDLSVPVAVHGKETVARPRPRHALRHTVGVQVEITLARRRAHLSIPVQVQDERVLLLLRGRPTRCTATWFPGPLPGLLRVLLLFRCFLKSQLQCIQVVPVDGAFHVRELSILLEEIFILPDTKFRTIPGKNFILYHPEIRHGSLFYSFQVLNALPLRIHELIIMHPIARVRLLKLRLLEKPTHRQGIERQGMHHLRGIVVYHLSRAVQAPTVGRQHRVVVAVGPFRRILRERPHVQSRRQRARNRSAPGVAHKR